MKEIIDAHVHALPRGDMCGGEVDARLETLLATLQSHGIGKAVLVPINDVSWQPVGPMNDFTVQMEVLRGVIPEEHLEAVLGGDIRRIGERFKWWSDSAAPTDVSFRGPAGAEESPNQRPGTVVRQARCRRPGDSSLRWLRRLRSE